MYESLSLDWPPNYFFNSIHHLVYAVLEKWNFENFRGLPYDDLLYRDDFYFWSNEEKNKAKDVGLTYVAFWNLLAINYSLENYKNGVPSDSVWVKQPISRAIFTVRGAKMDKNEKRR